MFSWIIEMILSGLPEWFWPAVAVSGVMIYLFAKLIGNFPTFKPYTFFIKPIGVLITIFGVFMFGGAGVTAIYQAQVDEMKAKIAKAEDESKSANSNLQTKIVTKTKVIHDRQVVVQEKIKEVQKQIDAECKLDPAVPKILNDAARNPLKVAK